MCLEKRKTENQHERMEKRNESDAERGENWKRKMGRRVVELTNVNVTRKVVENDGHNSVRGRKVEKE